MENSKVLDNCVTDHPCGTEKHDCLEALLIFIIIMIQSYITMIPMSGIDQQENMGYVSHEATLTNMDWIKTQYGLVITSIIRCGLKLCIHF